MLRANSFANKLVLFLITLSLCLCTLSGCTNQEKSIEGITFTDALGREVTVPRNPERVAALIGSFADVWVLSGGTICAAPEDARDDFELSFENVTNLGGAHSPNTEALLSANPDFVIASASTSSNVKLREMLEGAGITIAYFDVDCFEDYLHMLDICTNITGRKDLYEQNGLAVKTQIDGIKADFSHKNLSDEERTILLLRVSSGSVKAKGSTGTILGEMLKDLGCINIADSDSTLLDNLSVESILRSNPHRIFVVTMGDDTQKATENLNKMLNSNPAWASLDAMKENRLHIMDKKLFNLKPNKKWAEAYEQLSKILLET